MEETFTTLKESLVGDKDIDNFNQLYQATLEDNLNEFQYVIEDKE